MFKVIKRRDGKSPKIWCLDGTLRFGRKIKKYDQKSLHTSNYQEAQKIASSITKKVMQGWNQEYTWNEALDEMLKSPKHCPSKQRITMFKRIGEVLGHHYLDEFNNALITKYAYKLYPVLNDYKGKKLSDLPEEEKQRASAKFNTVNTNFICTVSKVLHFRAKNEWCNDPTIEHFPVLNARARKKDIYTLDEIRTIEEKCTDEGIKFLFLFLIYVGCRVSEALNMRWDKVNPINNRPMIDLEQEELNLWQFKTQEWITKPMHPKILKLIQKINYRENGLFEWHHLHEDQNNPRGIIIRWTSMCQVAEIKYKDRHACRHTHASMLGDNGASLQDIMKAVGWKSSKVALGYVKTDSKKVKDMINGLPE